MIPVVVFVARVPPHLPGLLIRESQTVSDPYPEIKIVPLLSTDEDYDDLIALYANRNDVAEDYAKALSKHGPVWDGYKPINQAILRRWSMAGLKYIKTRAWKIATGNL